MYSKCPKINKHNKALDAEAVLKFRMQFEEQLLLAAWRLLYIIKQRNT